MSLPRLEESHPFLHAQRLAAFMNFFNGNLAKEAGRLANWREKFWSRRYQAIVVSDEPQAQIERLNSQAVNGLEAAVSLFTRNRLLGWALESRPFSKTLQKRLELSTRSLLDTHPPIGSSLQVRS